MSNAKIIESVERIVREVTSEQVGHLRRGRVERTFTTDLANGLRAYFEVSTITVDSFYNKHHNATKRLHGKVIELDIAIHERGIDDKNLVAIELETSNRPSRDDVWKIAELTAPLGGYGYELGLFLVVGVGSRAGEIGAMEWYKDGRLLT